MHMIPNNIWRKTFYLILVNYRWFPKQKVVCICKNAELSLNAAKRFVEITGHSQSIRVHANLKKGGRHPKWIEQNIIFATAEVFACIRKIMNSFKLCECN